MRVACVLVPRFAVQVALRQRPDLAGRPVIVGGYPHERKTVAGASPEALASGVSPGISLRTAAGLCPTATFLPLDTSPTGEVFAFLLGVMESFSPVVEGDPAGAFYLDVTGLSLSMLGRDGPPGEEAFLQALAHEAAERSGLCVQAGAGSGKFVALVAATLAGEGATFCIPTDRETAALAAVPAATLPCTAEMQRRLHLLGIRTLGELAALPFGPVQAQFGREGATMWRLARGEDDRPLVPRRLPPEIADARRFDSGVTSSEALLCTVEDALDALEPELKRLFVSFRQLTLRLELEEEIPIEAPAPAAGVAGHGTRTLRRHGHHARGPASTAAPSTTFPLSEPPESSKSPRVWLRTWTLHEPANEPRAALSLIGAGLRDLILPGPVEALRLSLHDLCREEGHQESLFSITARRVTQLREAMRQVEARCGRNLLRRVVTVDRRSRIPERRRALVEFRGPKGV